MDENGNYPEDSINYLVSEKLKKYAQNSAKYNQHTTLIKVTYIKKCTLGALFLFIF